MEIPAYIVLIVYGAALLVIVVFSFFNVYHVMRFGMHTATAYAMSAVYVVVVSLIVVATWASLSSVDWRGSFSVELPAVTISPES
ncbi:MAG: hypothetical protein HY567_00735 [Candidatus Kerfeldbacteria bacterium]|nr:hypothetical protein [Candidatus Kerfeldbacteria bacterium]